MLVAQSVALTLALQSPNYKLSVFGQTIGFPPMARLRTDLQTTNQQIPEALHPHPAPQLPNAAQNNFIIQKQGLAHVNKLTIDPLRLEELKQLHQKEYFHPIISLSKTLLKRPPNLNKTTQKRNNNQIHTKLLGDLTPQTNSSGLLSAAWLTDLISRCTLPATPSAQKPIVRMSWRQTSLWSAHLPDSEPTETGSTSRWLQAEKALFCASKTPKELQSPSIKVVLHGLTTLQDL